jgi:hypothetical protein
MGRRRTHAVGLAGMLLLISVIVVISVIGEIIANTPLLVLLALIPIAYIAGACRERYRITGNTRKIDANTHYGPVTGINAVSPYPCDAEPVTQEHPTDIRTRILDDPRSGARPIGNG